MVSAPGTWAKLPYAIKCFEEAVAINDEMETLTLLANAYIQANRLDDARITFNRMAEKEPEQVNTFLSLASICFMQEDYEGMNDACQKALALDDKNPLTYYLTAKAAVGMKEEINAQERAGFNRDSLCFAIFGIVTVLSIAPLYAFLDYIGCLIWALIVGVAGYFCGRVELYKTMFDIQTYKEILAFQQGADLSALSAVRAERNVVKHRASKAVMAIASALIGGACAYGGMWLLDTFGVF